MICVVASTTCCCYFCADSLSAATSADGVGVEVPFFSVGDLPCRLNGQVPQLEDTMCQRVVCVYEGGWCSGQMQLCKRMVPKSFFCLIDPKLKSQWI